MSVSGLSFAERGGRLVSRRGRGRTSERERVAIESRLVPSAREVFPVLRERLLESRPVITEEHEAAWPEIVRQTTRKRKADPEFVQHVRWHYVTVPAVFGAPTFRNVFEDGEHR